MDAEPRSRPHEVLDDLEPIRSGFEAVVGATEDARSRQAADVDVRAYLLDPPPTADQIEREERRRTIVRRASLGGAAIVALLLLAPWPGPGAEQAPGSSPPAVPVESMPASPRSQAQPASTVPQRLDVPASRPRASTPAARRAAPTTRRAAPARIQATRPRPVEHDQAIPAAATAARPARVPERPAVADPGVLVPVM